MADLNSPVMPVNAALGFASIGMRVFPLLPGKKTPATRHGFTQATSDPDRIRGWWAKNPYFNVGLATDGLLVIDCDNGKPWLDDKWGPQPAGVNCGEDVFATVAAEADDFSYFNTVWVVATRSGGRHYIWAAPEGKTIRSRAGVFPWVDVRGKGGYIVGCWSFADGGRYSPVFMPASITEAGNVEFADRPPLAPSWLVDALADQPARELDPWDRLTEALDRAPEKGSAQGYAAAALQGEITRVLESREGTRNHTLNRAAFSLGQLIADGHLDEATVTHELQSAAQAVGLSDHEAAITIRSGLRAGAGKPRAVTR